MRLKSCMAVLVAAVLLLDGCGMGSDLASSVTVTDSAGVRIVHHPLAPSPPHLVSEIDEAIRLEDDPSRPMFDVRSALRLGDRGYAVADGGNARVLFYSSTGALLSSTGREGEGPGEFQHLTSLSRGQADSLLVWDRRLRRMSVLSPTGTFVRSFSLESTDEVPFANVVGVYADRSMLATGFVDTGDGGPAQGRRAYTSPSFHYGPDGSFRTESGSYSTGESFYEVSERGFSVFPVPFGREVFRQTAGDLLLVAASDEYELRYFGRDGTLTSIVRRTARDRPVTVEAHRTLVESLVSDVRAGQEERFRSVLAGMEVPDRLPEFSAVFADALGRVLAREYEVEQRPDADWRIYDRDGMAVGATTLPSTFQLMDAGRGFVVGVVPNDLDVQTVVHVPVGDR